MPPPLEFVPEFVLQFVLELVPHICLLLADVGLTLREITGCPILSEAKGGDVHPRNWSTRSTERLSEAKRKAGCWRAQRFHIRTLSLRE